MADTDSSWWSSENDRQYATRRASMARQVFSLLAHGFAAGLLALAALAAALWVLLQIGGSGALLTVAIVVVAGIVLFSGLLLALVYANAVTCGDPYDQRTQPDGIDMLVRTRDKVLLRAQAEGPSRASRTIVFAHGICSDMRVWRAQRAALPEDCRALFYDARGHGRSGDGKLDDKVPGLRVLADDLGRVIDAGAPTKDLVLVGHSMGGMTIFALAAIRPDIFARVRGILILDATPGPSKDAVRFGLPWMFAPAIWFLQKYSAAIARLAGFLPAFALRILGMGPYLLAMRWLAAGGNSGTSLTARRLAARMVYESHPRRYAGHLAAIFEHDERPSLRRIAPIPTTIIAGEKDRLITLSSYDGWIHALPESRFVSVADGSHMTMLEHHELVGQELERLVEQGTPVAVTVAEPEMADAHPDSPLPYVAVLEAITHSTIALAPPFQKVVKRILGA